MSRAKIKFILRFAQEQSVKQTASVPMAKHIGIDKILIPYATNRKPVLLIGVEPVDSCVTVAQPPVPCTGTIELAKRPKGAGVPYIMAILV